jgi:hypothetical protein
MSEKSDPRFGRPGAYVSVLTHRPYEVRRARVGDDLTVHTIEVRAAGKTHMFGGFDAGSVPLVVRSQSEADQAFGKGAIAFPAALADVAIRPHPIVKLAASLVGDAMTEAELDARRELRYLARRWQTKLRPPLLVAADLRTKGILWRMKGIGAC